MKTQIIIVVAVFVVFLIGYYNAERQKIVSILPISEEIEQNVANESQQIQDDCASIFEEGKRNLCYFENTVSKNDPKLCKDLVNPDLVIRCYQAIALSLKDPNICVNIHEDQSRDMCYKQIAEAKHDPLLCRSITLIEIRTECYQNTNTSNA
jgi:hypothetical protein